MFGSAKEVSGAGLRGIDRVYTKRFPATLESDLIPYRFYVFHPRRVKLFDERELGSGVFVTARVRSGGQVAWERTELYESRESEIETSEFRRLLTRPDVRPQLVPNRAGPRHRA
jgi:hypothetical protein